MSEEEHSKTPAEFQADLKQHFRLAGFTNYDTNIFKVDILADLRSYVDARNDEIAARMRVVSELLQNANCTPQLRWYILRVFDCCLGERSIARTAETDYPFLQGDLGIFSSDEEEVLGIERASRQRFGELVRDEEKDASEGAIPFEDYEEDRRIFDLWNQELNARESSRTKDSQDPQ